MQILHANLAYTLQACQNTTEGPEPVLLAPQLIHMDLKSKNVLLNGRKDLAKIADVGLSRIIQSTLGGAGSTPFGVGTFEYTAPEILLGRQCNEKVRNCCYKHLPCAFPKFL